MSVVEEIKARLNIVDVVSQYVSLQRAGRYYKALCPFHSEKTPSFVVNPERQSWRCFGACSTGGDVFSFVMRVEGLDFGQALRSLAQRAGVALRERGEDEREPLYRANQEAARFFQEALASSEGAHARRYLRERGVDDEAARLFQLGFSPGHDALKAHLRALGIDEEVAVKAGLLHRREDGSTRDFFRRRLMFPIHDAQGRVCGFGGRSLEEEGPKYINTPATPVFDKRGTLYGLHLAAGAIRQRRRGVIVEGYMDCIAAHQHGYANVVASMGTALTDKQVALLRGLASSFVLALDPDAAGQEATLRSLEASWRVFERAQVGYFGGSAGLLYRRESLELCIAALPTGMDPDQLIRRSPKEWERLTEEAQPLLDYLIPALAARFDLTTPEGKAQAAEALFPLIASLENPFAQDRYFRRLAQVLEVSEAALEASVGRPRPPRRGGRRRRREWREAEGGREPEEAKASPSALAAGRESLVEEYALALLLRRPELKERVQGFPAECFRDPAHREIFTRWLSSTTMEELREALDEALHPHLDHLSQRELAPADLREMEVALSQCLQRIRQRHLKEVQEALLATEDAGTPPPWELEQRVSDVNAGLKDAFSQPGPTL